MKRYIFTLLYIIVPVVIFAQSAPQTSTIKAKKKHKTSYYFSWGYNEEWYTHSNVKISQPSLNNDYTMENVRSHDHIGWDKIIGSAITIPQYNYRLGFFFNEEKGLALEINFDHTKYLISDPQNIQVKGTINDKPATSPILFTQSNGFYYYLNNGANFFLINIVKRKHIFNTKDNNLKIDLLGKAGIGPVVPHVQNSLFGEANDPHFQLGGWNTGIEGTVKVTLFKYVYLEYCNKLDYARYSHLQVYDGRAKQAFGTYEMILNLGITIPGRK
ncbi:MAG TPA: hypothetical protein VN721_03830 [Flavipsychrobacter sp.]|nr:hypothetical protein [Flavipsychrobacter sp.]